MVIKMNKCTNCVRTKHRTENEKKNLKRWLKILSGQISGIEQMIDDDRYCDDVLLQISSATNALKSLGAEILKNHMETCMIDEINKGNNEVVKDIISLMGKLKWKRYIYK